MTANPSKNSGLTPAARPDRLVWPAMETAAEIAWRYGTAGLRAKYRYGVYWFPDGSAMDVRTGVLAPYDQRKIDERFDDLVADFDRRMHDVRPDSPAPDWSAA